MIDSLGIISNGRIIATGTADEIRSRGERLLRVKLRHPRPGWSQRIPGNVMETEDGTFLIDSPTTESRDVLAALMIEGDVEQFGWDQPRLADIFREMVA